MIGPELHARSGDPATSHKAMAKKSTVAKVKSASAIVIELHQEHGPLALFELEPLFAEIWRKPHGPNLPRQGRTTGRDRGLLHKTGKWKMNPATRCWGEVWEYREGEPPTLCFCPNCGRLMGRNLPWANPDVELLQPPCS